MTPIRTPWAAALALSVLAAASAQAAGDLTKSAESGPTLRAQRNAEAVQRADAAFREAREACLRHPQSAQAACLEDARQAHAQALAGAAGAALPAVQTESAVVTDTGVAPSVPLREDAQGVGRPVEPPHAPLVKPVAPAPK